MAEDKEFANDANDKSGTKQADNAELSARVQQKTEEQRQAELKSKEQRKDYQTPSSTELPKLKLDQQGNPKIGDSVVKGQAQASELKADVQPPAPSDGKQQAAVKVTENADHSKTKVYADNSRVEVRRDEKVSQAAAADGHKRDFTYNIKGELTEVKSTFTGHTWKRVEVEGKEAWVNEKGTVWHGKFSVDKDGNLGYQADNGTSYVFTKDGHTQRAHATPRGPEEAHRPSAVPQSQRDAATGAKPTEQASDKKAEAAEKPPLSPEQQKAAQQLDATNHFMQVANFTRVTPDAAKAADALQNLNPDQVKQIKEMYKKAYGVELEDDLHAKFPDNKAINKAFDALGTAAEKRVNLSKVDDTINTIKVAMFIGSDGDSVIDKLKNSSQTELQVLKERYKKTFGRNLEDDLKEEFEGQELKKILYFLNRKDDAKADIPPGVDKKEMLQAVIDFESASKRLGGLYETEAINKVLAGKTADQIKAMNELYKERYGISLEDASLSTYPFKPLTERVAEANKWQAEKATQKVEGEAQKIFDGTSFWGDSQDVTQVLAGKTEAQIKQIAEAFQKKHGYSLEEHIKVELDEPKRSEALHLLHHKDTDLAKLPAGVDRQKMQVAVDDIYNAEKVYGKVFNSTYDRLLAGKTTKELTAINAMFQEKYGETLEDHLKKNAWQPKANLDAFLVSAREYETKHENFKASVENVDQQKAAQMAEKVEELRHADKPKGWYGMPLEWNSGAHPVEKYVENLSAAELKALQDAYKEKYGFELKDVLAQISPAVAQRMERTLDRTYGGPLDRMSVPERADARERAEVILVNGAKADAIFKALEKRSPEQIAGIKEAFRELSGKDIEDWLSDRFSGDDKERALNYVKYGSRDDAANLHLAITEGSQTKVRTMIETLSSKQIEALDALYRDHYGTSLKEALTKADDLNEKTRAAMDIYLKGADKLTTDDWKKLVEISTGPLDNLYPLAVATHAGVNVGDFDMYKEIMAAAPQSVREQILKDIGEDKLKLAFIKDQEDALEYTKYGKLSTARVVDKNDCIDDDEDAIELGLKEMAWKKVNKQTGKEEIDADSERALYRRGAQLHKDYMSRLDDFSKGMALMSKKDGFETDDSMSAYDKKAVETFLRLNSSIDGPCDNSECTDWRNMAVYPGGQQAVTDEINNLSKEDWQKLKADPKAKEEWIKEKGIDLFTGNAYAACVKLLDQKLAAPDYTDLKYAGAKDIEEYIRGRQQGVMIMPPEGSKVLEGIEHMSLDDQKRYQVDGPFHERLDSIVANPLVMNDAQREAAQHMLKLIIDHKRPEMDFIDKINVEGGKKETDETQVIRWVEQEFIKSEQKGEKPSLHERVTNPKTEQDIALKERLDKALHNALEDDEYEQWAKPVLAAGRLTFEQKLALDKDKGDKESVFTDIKNLANGQDQASKDERHKLATDQYYRNSVLRNLEPEQKQVAEDILKHGEERHQIFCDPMYRKHVIEGLPKDQQENAIKILNLVDKDPEIATNAQHREQILAALSPGQREVAENVLKWGQMPPEDMVRSYILKLGVSKEDMMDRLRQLTPAQNAEFRDQYAAKFNADVVTVLGDKLSKHEKAEVLQEIRIDPITAREALQDVKEVVDKSNSGFGARVTSWWGSGAGDMAADKVLQLQGNIEQASARGEEYAVDDAKKLANSAYKATELFEKAKEKTADAMADIVLSVATIAVPGGLALRSLLVVAALGGGTKVAIKYAITGDASVSDFASGMVDTALAAVGPGEIAKAAGLGRKAATRAAENIIAKGLIKEGEELAFNQGLRSATAHAIADGSGMITDKTLDKLVLQVAKEGANDAEKAALRQTIKESLEAELRGEVRSGMRKVITGAALDTGAGLAGGTAGGTVRGIFNWDGEKSFSENMSNIFDSAVTSGIYGAGGALVFSSAFKIAGAGWRKLRGAAPHAPGAMNEQELLAKEGDFAIVKDKNAPAPGGDPISVTPDALKGEFKKVGNSNYYVDGEANVYQAISDGAGPVKLVKDERAAIAISEEAAQRIERKASAMEAAHPASRAEISVRKETTARGEQEIVQYKAAGDKVDMYEKGGWFYPVRQAESAALDRGVKLHVFANGSQDLGRLQEVLIPALMKDPELLRMVPEWKTLDPRFMDPAAVQGGKLGERPAFTIGVKDPADLVKVQKRIDEILATHPELRLDTPPRAINNFAGESNRVGSVRDFWPAGTLDSEVKLDPAKLEKYRDVLDVKEGRKFTASELEQIERGTGLSLRYDDQGNLLVKEVGAVVDKDVAAKINESLGLKPTEKIPPAELRQVEAKSGLKEGSLAYDSAGNLVLKGTPGESRMEGDNYFLQMLNAERKPRGAEYSIRDRATGESIKVKSEGLTDQPAMYQLSRDYGIDPVDAYVSGKTFAQGDKVTVSGAQFDVVGMHDGRIVVRPAGAEKLEGKAVAVSADDLASKYERVGNSDYYVDKDGVYHKLHNDGKGGKELIADWDIETVAPKDVQSKVAAPKNIEPHVESTSLIHRQYAIDGNAYELAKRPMQGIWFWGKEGQVLAPIKVHVMTDGAKDLGALQKVLIPALNEDKELASMVSAWKTYDPQIGVGRAEPGTKIPTVDGNDAKGFTIYLNNPKDAARVQEKIDKLLVDKGLAREARFDINNVDTIVGRSHRVGIVRDAYPLAYSESGKAGYMLDEQLARKMEQEAGVGSGQRIPEDKLRQLEHNTGLKTNTLAYDKEGKLMLKAEAKGTIPETPEEIARGLYANDAGVLKQQGQLTDRPAIYALAQHYDLDPAHLYEGQNAVAARAVSHSEGGGGGGGGDHGGGGGDHGGGAGGEAPRRSRDTLTDMKSMDPQADLSKYNLSDSQKQVLDIANLAQRDRAAMVEWIQRNPMYKEAMVHDFAQQADAVIQHWNNDAFKELQSSSQRAQESYGHYREQVVAPVGERVRQALPNIPPEEIDNVLMRFELFNDGLKNPQDMAALARRLEIPGDHLEQIYSHLHLSQAEQGIIANHQSLIELNESARRNLDSVVRSRKADLQKMLDDFTRANDLPPIKVTVWKDSVMGTTSGGYLDNQLILPERALAGNVMPENLASTVYHELVHNQENFLMVKKVVNDSPPPLKASEMERLRDLKKQYPDGVPADLQAEYEHLDDLFKTTQTDFKSRTDKELSLDRLIDVLRTNSRGLEESRAELLMIGFREEPGLAEFKQAIGELQKLDTEMGSLNTPEGVRSMLQRLANDHDGKAALALFGHPEIPESLKPFLSAIESPVPAARARLPMAEAEIALRNELAANFQRIADYRDANYSRYITSVHEIEAALIDRVALDQANKVRALASAPDTSPMTAIDPFADEDTGVYVIKK